MRPVLTDAERQGAVKACRFVDEIIPASPYVMTAEYIEELVKSHRINYIVHGDDPCFVNGVDVFETAKKAGMFKSIPRTEGISTTDIVGRLLMLTSDHHTSITETSPTSAPASPLASQVSQRSNFLVTSQLMRAFSAALTKSNALNQRIVYVDGAWDMFHAGHVALLSQARALGDFLIVGVHSDEEVNKQRGSNHPIMAMHERVLSVLGCRYVDDVLIDAPWQITREMIATLNITVVARGTIRDYAEGFSMCDPHKVPITLGIHVQLKSELGLTLEEIEARLNARRQKMVARHAEKQQSENEWYRSKHGLDKES